MKRNKFPLYLKCKLLAMTVFYMFHLCNSH